MKETQRIFFVSLILLLAISLNVFSQEQFTISGHVKDKDNGEELIGATIYDSKSALGTVTNVYGFYSLTLPAGNYELSFSYLGFESQVRSIELNQDMTLEVELPAKGISLEQIVVTDRNDKENVDEVEMSTIKMKVEAINKIPALLGEVDIIKAIQLLPGVQTIGEGTSGFYVRGGAVDQNLILLDEAPVYNASHLLGFFSVFNPDAIKDIQLYKGGIPARYGGRLSSVLDIRMKEGNMKKFSGRAGIGTISSRATIEAPIIKNKGSFLISGRRTYADIFLALSPNEDIRDNKLYFYDLNTKANYRFNENNRIFLSGYFGRDVFSFADEFGFNWGNATATARWNHVFNKKLFSNLTFIYSNFDYSLGDSQGVDAFEWKSNINDYSAKLDFNYFMNPRNTIRFGLISTFHKFDPGKIGGVGENSAFNTVNLEGSNAIESGIYVSNEHKIGNALTAQYGLRVSLFQSVGPGTVYEYDDNYELADSAKYSKGDFYNTYSGIEPRLGLKYSLDDESSIKASYNRIYQYVQLASNSTSSSPLDIWFPASPNIEPQRVDQIALGYFRNLRDDSWETSAEVYYKTMTNTVDFKDHAQLLLNQYLEGDLRIGEGRSYGLELMAKKQKGALTGWVSYTLARTERRIETINDYDWYPAKYDKTHDVAVVLSYELNDRVTLSGNWVFGTGSAVTMPTGRFEFAGMIAPVYSDRNAERLPAYHRMDLACTLGPKAEHANRKVQGEWVFSVYNAYSRKNAFSINFNQDPDNPNRTIAQKTYLFPIIPSITRNFNF